MGVAEYGEREAPCPHSTDKQQGLDEISIPNATKACPKPSPARLVKPARLGFAILSAPLVGADLRRAKAGRRYRTR